METIWFMLVAVMIAVYVVLDGFDLGAGIIQLLVARTERERRQVLRSIGPVWDGNEVWLLAGGGTLYFAFPALYAASFSGFFVLSCFKAGASTGKRLPSAASIARTSFFGRCIPAA